MEYQRKPGNIADCCTKEGVQSMVEGDTVLTELQSQTLAEARASTDEISDDQLKKAFVTLAWILVRRFTR